MGEEIHQQFDIEIHLLHYFKSRCFSNFISLIFFHEFQASRCKILNTIFFCSISIVDIKIFYGEVVAALYVVYVSNTQTNKYIQYTEHTLQMKIWRIEEKLSGRKFGRLLHPSGKAGNLNKHSTLCKLRNSSILHWNSRLWISQYHSREAADWNVLFQYTLTDKSANSYINDQNSETIESGQMLKLKAIDMEMAGWEFVMTNNFQETVFKMHFPIFDNLSRGVL